jgi:hypothetical protein
MLKHMWVLPMRVAEWRWMKERDSTRYPSARLFRQITPRCSVVVHVRARLVNARELSARHERADREAANTGDGIA